MRCRDVLVAALLVTPATAGAQTPYPECNKGLIPASVQNTNLCNAAVDFLRISHPAAGLLLGGGNPVLGKVTALGGFPNFSIGVRVNASQFVTPDLSYDGSSSTVGKDDEIPVPFPTVEAALGVTNGFGARGLFALDLIGAAQVLPVGGLNNVRLDDEATTVAGAALGFGYGGRVAVLRGNGLIPEVTGSAVWRSLPRLAVGDVTAGDNYAGDFNLRATNLRLMAGWEVGVLKLALGYGWDWYKGDAHVEVTDQVGGTLTERVSVNLDESRTVMYANVGFEFGFFMVA
ncbi:MAG: hypothetical protein E4H38_05095, partial [Gemmatimonadales bacterium]